MHDYEVFLTEANSRVHGAVGGRVTQLSCLTNASQVALVVLNKDVRDVVRAANVRQIDNVLLFAKPSMPTFVIRHSAGIAHGNPRRGPIGSTVHWQRF